MKCRRAVSTDLNSAGVSHLAQRYLTGHTTRDILNEYVALEVHTEMPKHFRRIRPLLDAIQTRALQLGMRHSMSHRLFQWRYLMPSDIGPTIMSVGLGGWQIVDRSAGWCTIGAQPVRTAAKPTGPTRQFRYVPPSGITCFTTIRLAPEHG
jgi:hypothetical protein